MKKKSLPLFLLIIGICSSCPYLADNLSDLIPTPSQSLKNLAVNKPVSASSEQSSKGNSAVKGNDNDLEKRWCTYDYEFPAWWRVDLGSSHNISYTVITWEKSDYYYQYTIDVSNNDTNWTTIINKSSNTNRTESQTDYFTTTARYIRITVINVEQPAGSANWASFWEAQVWGY